VCGASVGIPGFSVEIKNNCNAIYEIGLYASAIFAYPAILTRTLGFAIGSALLYLVNLLRVLSLIGIGRYFPGGFQIAHIYLWQAPFLALVAACWLSRLPCLGPAVDGARAPVRAYLCCLRLPP